MTTTSTLEWSLLVAATLLNGILAGGSLIKSVVELPARRTMGLPAMAAYHRAADLRTGFLIYPALGLGAPALTIALGITFVLDPTVPTTAASFAYLAAAFSAAHVFATTRAAPNLLRLRSGIPQEAILTDVYRGFTRWHAVRATLQVAAFVAIVFVVGLHPAPRPLTEGAWVALSTDGRKWTFDRNWSGVFKGRLWLPTDLFVPPLYGLHRRRPSVMAHRSADGRIGP